MPNRKEKPVNARRLTARLVGRKSCYSADAFVKRASEFNKLIVAIDSGNKLAIRAIILARGEARKNAVASMKNHL